MAPKRRANAGSASSGGGEGDHDAAATATTTTTTTAAEVTQALQSEQGQGEDAGKTMPTRSVRVRFRASKEFLARVGLDPDVERVEDSPSVALPTQLSRAGLTEVVRQLWEETRPDVEVPTGKLEFRDVARDELIRGGAMEKYLTKHGVTEEETIVLEYAPPVGAPMEVGEGSPVPDWLACVAAASAATRTSSPCKRPTSRARSRPSPGTCRASSPCSWAASSPSAPSLSSSSSS